MQQTDNQFFLLAESSPDAIFVATRDCFAYVNPAALRLFGATAADQLLGQPFIARIHPDDRAIVKARARRLYDEGERAALLEETYLRLDGTPVAVEVAAVPFRFDGEHGALVFVRDITLRKRAQDELVALNQTLELRVAERTRALHTKEGQLREALALTENILQASPAGILAYRHDGRCILANPAAAVIIGGSREQLLQQDFHSLASWRDAGLREVADRVLANGIGEELEVHFTSTFGQQIWAAAQLSRFMNGGEPHLLVVLHDVTEQRQAARFLAEREQEFRTLADNVPDNIIRYGLDGRARYINRTLECALGLPAADVVGKAAREWAPDGRFDALDAAVRRVGASAQPEEFEQVVPGPQGQPRYHCLRIVPEIGAEGCPVSVLAVGRDMTEQKLAAERTRQAATVFENASESIILADLDGDILAVNRAFTVITGYGEAEVLGRNPRLLQSGRQGRDFYQVMWENLLLTGHWQGELWNRRKSGEVFPTWTTITTVHDDHARPTHYVAVSTDMSRLKRSEEQLAHLVHHDPLTDLPNRLLLETHLTHALDRAVRDARRAAVLFIDLDRFKTVNDSLGHVVGDQLLVDAARRWRERVRDEDTLGRFGGDEFLLVLEPIAAPEEAALVARDLLAALAAPFQVGGGREVYLGASIGISVFPDDGSNAAELLRGADAAMYQAKEEGRHRFCFYTADMNVKAVAQLELEAGLRRALARSEFVLHYQPKADLRTGLVYGAEALIRWQPEAGDLVGPDRFIPLAEKTGLIVPIGNWVIDAACRQLRAWREAGLRDLRLAVNVSARQFHGGDLVAVVTQALARHQVPAGSLELELTESILMEDPEATVASLARLKQLGVTLALDDFGTGYSSFTYLSRFPIDALKIDRSFVEHIATDPHSATIAVSIIELAHRLHRKVVAEGVETEAQLGFLRQRDCDEMQGYYFARPLPAADLEQLLREGRSLPTPRTSDACVSRTLLLVDDEPNILSALRRLLRQEGYRILTAESGQQALEMMATQPVQVVLSDQRMPQMTGTEFLSRVKDMHPDTVRMVLSGYTDLDSVTCAVNGGAIYKFLHKPWDDAQLREHVRDAFRYYEKVVLPRAKPYE